jgi:hypothetical protein
MQKEISKLAQLEDTHKVFSQEPKSNQDQYRSKEAIG